jgi:hypothetical protein
VADDRFFSFTKGRILTLDYCGPSGREMPPATYTTLA